MNGTISLEAVGMSELLSHATRFSSCQRAHARMCSLLPEHVQRCALSCLSTCSKVFLLSEHKEGCIPYCLTTCNKVVILHEYRQVGAFSCLSTCIFLSGHMKEKELNSWLGICRDLCPILRFVSFPMLHGFLQVFDRDWLTCFLHSIPYL